jgi:AcrR family transcriptional regulator
VKGGGRYRSQVSTAEPRRERTTTGSTTRRDLVEQQIMQHATALFAERGFAGTSLQDIADAMGVTRPALYHYVANKDELLGRLVAEITAEPAVILEEINKCADLGPLDRLRRMVRAIAVHQAAAPERFRLLIRSEAELPEPLSKEYDRGRRRVLTEFVKVLKGGIDAGVFRPMDPRIGALGIIGMINWMAWWYRPDRDGAEAVAHRLVDMAVNSVLRERAAAELGDGPTAAIATVRQNLDYLEQYVRASRETRS